ncbi:MAG: hypothetical protein ACMZ7B_04955 [Balneola sp.]
MHRQRDASGLIPFHSEIETFIPAKGTYAHLRQIYLELEKQLIREQNASEEKGRRPLHMSFTKWQSG